MIERNIRYAVDYGALFEINTAALRKGWPSPYPAEDVVEVCVYYMTQDPAYLRQSSLLLSQIIRRHNGRFTLSDDSHGPHAVGLNYHRLPKYLHAMDISELWVLERSDVPNAAGRIIHATKLSEELLDHEFWHARSNPSINTWVGSPSDTSFTT
jgi:histidinol-phosphatase (PHP family)